MVSLPVEAGTGEGQRRDIRTGWKLPYHSPECLKKRLHEVVLKTESAGVGQCTKLVKIMRWFSEKSKALEEANKKMLSRKVHHFHVTTTTGPVDPELDSTAT